MESTIEFTTTQSNTKYKDMKEFDDTKAGVKGLIDSGIKTVPTIFLRPPEELEHDKKLKQFQETDSVRIPVIDLHECRDLVIDKVRVASGTWGCFQVINHGIPKNVLDRTIDGVQLFHEQDVEVKRKLYHRNSTKNVVFNSNYDLYDSPYANWRDTLAFPRKLNGPDLSGVEGLPISSREAILDYMNHVEILGATLLELLSEALGLEPNRLRSTGCAGEFALVCHYYPKCPEPELAIGTRRHTDPVILALLLQNQVSALQVLYEAHSANVDPIPGAIVVNTGDLLQLMSNDKFKSVEHRVLAKSIGPRISVACFFTNHASTEPQKTICPIKELTSEDCPAKYKEVSLSEFMARFYAGRHDKPLLDHYRI